MTLADLISNEHFRYNQTFLAKSLNVNRGTLRKYLKDVKGEFHFVKICSTPGRYELFTNQTNNI